MNKFDATIESVLPLLEKKGDVLGILQHPYLENNYLFLVLIDQGYNYVVWWFDARSGEFYRGDYFHKNIDHAVMTSEHIKHTAYNCFRDRSKSLLW